LIAIVAVSSGSAQSSASAKAPADKPASATDGASAPHAAVVTKYCVTCHNDRMRTADLSLEHADLSDVPKSAATWEKVIRKVRAGMMPPAGMPRPDAETLDGFVGYLETSIDHVAAANPRPGRTAVHRLNRAEYANAIRDLLALDIDATALLPPDDESSGFDNIADVLTVSPSLMERYLSASWNISRMALGNPALAPSTSTYRVRPDLSQDQHIEGLPPGTRGGMLVTHTFPVDAEYVIKLRLWRNTFDLMRGMEDPHEIEIALDGVRIQSTTAGGRDDFSRMAENPGTFGADLDRRLTIRLPVKAGEHTIWATTVLKSHAPRDDLIKPFLRTTVDGLDIMGDPSVDRLTVEGPFAASGPGDTASRRKILLCNPPSRSALRRDAPATGAGATAITPEELACARKIVSTLARQAYRRPVDPAAVEILMKFYRDGRKTGGSFERGIEASLQFILASPEFLFRIETDPPEGPRPASSKTTNVYRLDDLALASRLSFFLWSSLPDEKLLALAAQGRLKEPAVLEQQVRRMLADPRSKTLIDNFAEQWLHLRNLKSSNPDLGAFPDFDDNLRQSMKEETELFFASIMREDRSVMDLVNADYTFVNERLARHYGIPDIYGSRFRRVQIPDERRRGLLGQASILTVTSYPNRTSPVERGKWILTNLLGVPPQPPPPNVPPLADNAADGRVLSLRERMERHRASPVCAGCHRLMDPIGFALENFDGTGRWRTKDEGQSIDPKGTLFTGAPIDGVTGLRAEIAKRPEVFVGVFTEKMLTYALGRGTEYYDMPAVRKIVRDARPTDYRFSSIVLGVVRSVPFQMKERSTPATTTARADLTANPACVGMRGEPLRLACADRQGPRRFSTQASSRLAPANGQE
jgi:mono/diheme cytochrome c family protein